MTAFRNILCASFLAIVGCAASEPGSSPEAAGDADQAPISRAAAAELPDPSATENRSVIDATGTVGAQRKWQCDDVGTCCTDCGLHICCCFWTGSGWAC